MIRYSFEIPADTMVKISIHLEGDRIGDLLRHLDTLRNSARGVPESKDLTLLMGALLYARGSVARHVFEVPDKDEE